MNYENIAEVREVECQEANKLLKSKKHEFYLIKQPVKIKRGEDETIIYVLARFDERRLFEIAS